MRESELIDELKKNFANLVPVPGVRINIRFAPPQSGDCRFDFVADVLYENLRLSLSGEILAQAGMALFRSKLEKLNAAKSRNNDLVPIIAASYLSPEKQELCRQASINFIDLSGNAFLAHGSLYLERIGFPNKYPEIRLGRDPFADKASLILRQLLRKTDKDWGVRELAQSVGLDPGFVSRMAKALEARAYIIRKKAGFKLRDPESILDDWVRAYSLQKNRLSNYFCMASEPKEIMEKIRHSKSKLPNFALSVQAGASLVAPYAAFNQVHVYIESTEKMALFKKTLQIKPADQGANLILMQPFYKHAIFRHAQEIKGLKVVSALQLYLDLYHYSLRGREQAEHLYAKCLKPLLEK